MDYGARIAQYLEFETGGVLHAVGQGAIGVEAREGDERVLEILRGLQDSKAMLACTAERSLMRTLEGGCSVPIGVESSWANGGKTLRMRATVVSFDGTQAVDAKVEEAIETAEEAEGLGKRIAKELVGGGASKILEAINQVRGKS
jgi:hydroxymethylbilane synthase